MDTSAISYRVADFLKQHPPFQAIEEGDLLQLAANGRVRFFEPHEYLVWQGEPHKSHVFVIQQGTVSFWDEEGGQSALRDVRGPGDMLGIERFTGAPRCLYSARSASDVVIYAFPAEDFENLIEKYPYARQFVDAYETVAADYQGATDTRDLQRMFLHEVVGRKTLERCSADSSIREVARSLLATGADAIAVTDRSQGIEGVITPGLVLGWVAAGGGTPDQPISALLRGAPPAVASSASIIDGVLALGEADADALAVTSDGSPDGQLQALVTARDVARVFGDQPVSILREIRLAATTEELRELNYRARAFALQYLTNAGALDWVARVMSITDVTIVKRIAQLAGSEWTSSCLCFCGASGRGESLTRHAPQLVLIAEDDSRLPALRPWFDRVSDMLTECDYMPRADLTYDRAFLVAGKAEWLDRYEHWLRDPIAARQYLARPLFDLRPVLGRDSFWHDVQGVVAGAVDRDLLHLLANDCLASLPPLTFFQDAVVDESGEQAALFRLERSALRPVVDVGRVFGLAAKQVLGTSTQERFASARALLPEHTWIFRDASETQRLLLWQQARIGISQGTSGSDLPPALLSRHDRHVLKAAFRSILRLLEFTGNSSWFDAL